MHDPILFKMKCQRAAQQAVGKSFKIRSRNGSLVGGVISTCEFVQARERRCSVIAQFSVKIKTPEGFEHGPFVMEKLPR